MSKKETFTKTIGRKKYIWTFEGKKTSCFIRFDCRGLAAELEKIFKKGRRSNNFRIPQLRLYDCFIDGVFYIKGYGVTVCEEGDTYTKELGMEISRLKAERRLHNNIIQELNNFIQRVDNITYELEKFRDRQKTKYKNLPKR